MVEPASVSHTGRYWYQVDNLQPSEGEDAVVRLWAALPFSRRGQTVADVALAPEPTEIFEDAAGGNRIAYWEIRDLEAGDTLMFTVDFSVEGVEVHSDVDPDAVAPYDRDAPEYERYTRSEPWIEITPEIAAAARDVVGDERSPWRAARRIFDFVVRTKQGGPHLSDVCSQLRDPCR